MKHLSILILAAIAATTCNKSVEEQQLYLRGRLFLLDTVTNNIMYQPLSSKKVTLSDQPDDSLNFIYSVNTNAEGYFVFNIPESQSDASFTLRYEDSIGGYRYLARATTSAGNDSIRLIAKPDLTRINGFILYVKDSLEPAGSIPRCTVSIYNSKLLAEISDPAGAVETIMADNNGKAIKLNLPAGNYYINAQKQIDTIMLQRIGKMIVLPQSGIIRDTLQVRRK